MNQTEAYYFLKYNKRITFQELKEIFMELPIGYFRNLKYDMIFPIYQSIPEIQEMINNGFTFEDITYFLHFDLPAEHKYCPVCGKELHVVRLSHGYHKTCSKECGTKIGTKQRSATCLARYGKKSNLEVANEERNKKRKKKEVKVFPILESHRQVKEGLSEVEELKNFIKNELKLELGDPIEMLPEYYSDIFIQEKKLVIEFVRKPILMDVLYFRIRDTGNRVYLIDLSKFDGNLEKVKNNIVNFVSGTEFYGRPSNLIISCYDNYKLEPYIRSNQYRITGITENKEFILTKM